MMPATRTLLPQENFSTNIASRNQTTGPLQSQEINWTGKNAADSAKADNIASRNQTTGALQSQDINWTGKK